MRTPLFLLVFLPLLALALASAQPAEPVSQFYPDLNGLSPAVFCERIQETVRPTFECNPTLGHPVCYANWFFNKDTGQCQAKQFTDTLRELFQGKRTALLYAASRPVQFLGDPALVQVTAADGTPIQGALVTIFFPDGQIRVFPTDMSGRLVFPLTFRGRYSLEARRGDAQANFSFNSYASIFDVPLLSVDFFILYLESMEANSGIMAIVLFLLCLFTALLFNGNANAYFIDSPRLGLAKFLAFLSFILPLVVSGLGMMGWALLLALAEFVAVYGYFHALASAKSAEPAPENAPEK